MPPIFCGTSGNLTSTDYTYQLRYHSIIPVNRNNSTYATKHMLQAKFCENISTNWEISIFVV